MKVHKIKEYISQFKDHIQKDQFYANEFKWEASFNFLINWNEEELDLADMYHRSFMSQSSGSLWGGETDSPKSMMMRLIQTNPDFARTIFRDFFDESKELLLRLDRFGFHCDQLMSAQEKKFGKSGGHYHNDYKILSIYLAFKYPSQYCIFDYPAFASAMKKLELKDIPDSYAILRFFKLCKGLNMLLHKDVELVDLVKSKLSHQKYFQENSMILTHDFYGFVANIKSS